VAGEKHETAAGTLLAAALSYAARGWPVFPLNGKVPLTEHGFHDASADLERIRAWWAEHPAAGIGVPTGEPSGLLVVDIDTQHGGGRTWKALVAEHGKVPETAATLTGGGGSHLLFQHPGDVPSSTGKLAEHVDVRGDGGYAVLPPSTHPNGRAYRWLVPLEKGIAEPPAWLVELARGRRNGPAPKLDEIIPEGRRRAAMLSVAGKLKRSGLSGAEILPTLRELNRRCRPPLPESELESVAYRSTIEADAETAIVTAREAEPRALVEVVATFRRWLHLPDPGALYVVLACVVANRLPGDPVWLLLVAASSSGKTEVLFSLSGLPEVVPAATLTEAALLSGVPRREQAAGATGGLLKALGEYGILTLKDFGSVLSMHRDARAGTLAALRECYDGAWDRPVGADGGKVLSWRGKLGLIAGVTTVVDRHHAVMDALGSRFAFYRVEIEERKEQSRRALEHVRRAKGMREELREAVAGFFAGLELPAEERRLSESDVERLVALADFVTLARSPVERDAYKTREIELVPDAEAPARFAGMLSSLLEGLRLIGLDEPTAWRLVAKVALDSMPAQRRKVIEHLAEHEQTTAREAATMLGLPTTTARRTLEDLAAHGVVTRESGGEGKADTWALAAAIRDDYLAGTVPEMSGNPLYKDPHHAFDDFSGTVPEKGSR